ncbi:hypothetical protein HY967_02590 [Candidatus Jorgensenbacteria bacterium]|nr:hypothetical protein [Candidatus Jorgensenbacteria bacterium]
MVKRLISLLTNRTAWKLLFRGVFLSGTIFLAVYTGFAWWAVAALIVTVFWIHFILLERYVISVSFFIAVLASLFSLTLRVPNVLIGFLSIGILVALIGIGSLAFSRRDIIYDITETALAFLIFTAFFAVNSDEWWMYVLVFIAFVFLTHESFVFGGVPWRMYRSSAAVAVGLVVIELAWIVRFLPLGFINAAALLALFCSMTRNAFIVGFKGNMTPRLFLTNISAFIAVSMVIFAASKWYVQ